MSCIKRLLEIKGDLDYLQLCDGVFLENGGNYKDYDFCITFNDLGFRCGYVALPADNPIAKGDDNYGINLDVHRGITFNSRPQAFTKRFLGEENDCGDIWIGFDAGHFGDRSDAETLVKLFPDKAEYINLCRSMFDHGSIRSKEFMINECKHLIDQITAYRA